MTASLVPESVTLINASADVQRAAERLERLFAFAEGDRATRVESEVTMRGEETPAWRRWLDTLLSRR